jgi:threonine dehydrogenase-like Zn-dependent dehydrogenase
MYGPGDGRVEEREEPRVVEPTDATIRVSVACVCGSDLWPYRGVENMQWPAPMGHEYAGIVEEVETIKPGQFVVGSFWATDNTCEICRAGYQSACVNRVPMGSLGAQAELLRIPLADGTLVATPRSHPTTSSRACWRPPTCSAQVGSAPWPPKPARARPSPSWATARSACSPGSLPSSLAPSGSSP